MQRIGSLKSLGFSPAALNSIYIGNGLSLPEVRVRLASTLRPERFQHSFWVALVAYELAQLYGANPEKAYIAGLLHDCARDLAGDTLKCNAQSAGIDVLPIEKEAPILLHGKVGAVIAHTSFGVQDAEILRAIGAHVNGTAEDQPLADVLMVADYIEPGRCFPEMRRTRALASHDLRAAVVDKLHQVGAYMQESGMKLHPEFTRAIWARTGKRRR